MGLLLPLTPTLIYLKLKKIKGPKTHSLFTSLFHFHNHGKKRSIAGIKESFKIKCSTCKTSAGFTKEIPLKPNRTQKKVYQKIELTFNFTKEIHVKKFKIAFNFLKKSHRKNSPSILHGNPLTFFKKSQVGDHF